MENQTEHIIKPEPLSKAFFKDYLLLSKLRLSTTVVGTTLIAYFLGISKNSAFHVDWLVVFGLALGGILVTASANGFNQIIEKDLDKLMTRTMSRPVADGRMSVNDAMTFSIVSGILGLFALLYYTNINCAFLGLISLLTYTLAYTPLKKITPLSVFVGAIPGAIPPAIGWEAVSNNFVVASDAFHYIAFILFLIQFFWQFPHFWAIAWMLEDDYRKAGYTLLPNYAGRTKRNAMQTVWYSVILIVVSIYPLAIGFSSLYSLLILLPCGGFLLFRSVQLYQKMTIESARSLMFASLIYMPAVLISYFF